MFSKAFAAALRGGKPPGRCGGVFPAGKAPGVRDLGDGAAVRYRKSRIQKDVLTKK